MQRHISKSTESSLVLVSCVYLMLAYLHRIEITSVCTKRNIHTRWYGITQIYTRNNPDIHTWNNPNIHTWNNPDIHTWNDKDIHTEYTQTNKMVTVILIQGHYTSTNIHTKQHTNTHRKQTPKHTHINAKHPKTYTQQNQNTPYFGPRPYYVYNSLYTHVHTHTHTQSPCVCVSRVSHLGPLRLTTFHHQED